MTNARLGVMPLISGS